MRQIFANSVCNGSGVFVGDGIFHQRRRELIDEQELQRIAQLGVGHQRPLLVILKLHRAEKQRLRVDRAVAIRDQRPTALGKIPALD